MPKYCLNYESGNYEWIDENGYSYDQGQYVYHWDDSAYRQEETAWDDDEENHNSFSCLISDDDDSWNSWGNDDSDFDFPSWNDGDEW